VQSPTSCTAIPYLGRFGTDIQFLFQAFPWAERIEMAKRRQAARPKGRKLPTKPKRSPAAVDLKKEIATLRRELTEARERQTATSEVLQVISSTPGDLQLVFESMLENATRVCSAQFGTMNLYEDEHFRNVALHNVPAAYAEARQTYSRWRPHPKSGMTCITLLPLKTI